CIVSLQQRVNFSNFEPADLKVDVHLEFEDVGKFQCQHIHVPTGVFAQPVERKTKHPELRLSDSRKGHRGNLRKAKLSGRKNQPPPRYDSIRLIDDDRKHEPELFDACLELANMAGRVLAGVSSEGPQAVDVDQSWMKIARNRIAV